MQTNGNAISKGTELKYPSISIGRGEGNEEKKLSGLTFTGQGKRKWLES